MKNQKLLTMVEIAMFAAIGAVLDQIKFSIWGQGGSISLVMLPIILMGIRRGLSAGLVTGLLVGLLNLITGAQIFHWAQGLIDYFFAFSFVGFGAIVRQLVFNGVTNNNQKKVIWSLTLGTIIGGLLRFICHMISGVIFFSEYAGEQNVWIYSISYNGSFMLPSTILTAIVVVLLITASPRLIKVNH